MAPVGRAIRGWRSPRSVACSIRRTCWFLALHPSATVDATATIGEGTEIGAGAVIGPGAVIGARTRLDSNAVIGDAVVIGDDCVIGANCSINTHCWIAGADINERQASAVRGCFVISPKGLLRMRSLAALSSATTVEIGRAVRSTAAR